MKHRLIRFAKLASYPLFYALCLVVFGYLCFPFDQLRSRIVAEFDRMQQAERRRAPSSKAAMRLELGELDSYWLSGMEVRDAKLTIPPDTKSRTKSKLKLSGAKEGDEDEAPKPSTIVVDRVHARVRLLPLLIGSVRIDFGVEAFGGEISGTVPYGAESAVEVTIEGLQLDKVQPLQALTGLPVLGTVNGELSLDPKEGKFAKADGKLELRIGRVVIGDGKATLQGVALPAAQVGDLTITADAKDGTLTIDEISAAGRDFELSGNGRVRIREKWNRSRADIHLKFRFTDGYRDKDDTTRSLLGKPGSKLPPVLEFDPRVKRSKTADGFYGWHAHGTLGDLKFDPEATKGTSRSRTAPRKPAAKPRTKPQLKSPNVNALKNRIGRGGRPAAGSKAAPQPMRSPGSKAAPKAEAEAEAEDDSAAAPESEQEEAEPTEGGDDG